jgi:DNA-binding transcriptional LysR family regulator
MLHFCSMNWNDLRYLLVATREPSLRAAGRALCVNQTTVSRRLLRLQEELRVKLFDVGAQGLTLTPAGEEVLRAAAGVDDAVTALDRAIAGGDAQLRGPLRVTTTELLAAYDAELFHSFSERYPGIELELAVSDARLNISKREADVAVRFASKPPDSLVAKHLLRVDYAAYASKKLVKKMGARARLDAFPWLGWDESKGAVGTEAWMRTHVGGARVVCRFDSALAMHAAARAGMGAALLACAYAVRDDGLVALTPPEPALAWDLWTLLHPDLRKNARVRAFAEHAVEYFARA